MVDKVSIHLSFTERILQQLLLKMRPTKLASILKQLIRVKRRPIKTSYGTFWIDPISNFGAALTQEGDYEPSMRQTVLSLLHPSAIFVDIGANEGYFSVLAAKRVGVSGKVVAVEPQARLQTVIQKNLEFNKIENVTLIDSAISDQGGYAKFYISPDTNTGSSALHQATKYKLPTTRVKTITMSDLLDDANIDKVDLLKIDIEGFEYEAVLGAPEVFREQRVKHAAIELHPSVLAKRRLDSQKIITFLEDCDYRRDNRFLNAVWTANNEFET